MSGALAASESDLQQARVNAARGRWPELDATQIKPLGSKKFRGKLGDHTTGVVYDVVSGAVLEPGLYVQQDVADAFYMAAGQAVLLKVSAKPATLAEYEHEQAEQRQRREEAERVEQERFASLPRVPLTVSDLTGEELPTLRVAAAQLEQLGTVEAHNGRLVISMPESFPNRPRALTAARVLFHERALVLAALERREPTQPLADLLPDEPARP